MDALEFLITDHRQIEEYFDSIEKTADRTERRRIFTQIRERLMLHMQVEEARLFPEYDGLPGLDVLLNEAYENHLEISRSLALISGLADDDDFDAKVDDLIDAVEAHFTMEETEVFRKIRVNDPHGRLKGIGARLLQDVAADGYLKVA